MTVTKVLGFEIYLFDRLVHWSQTFYTSEAEVWKYLQDNVTHLCEEIALEDNEGLVRWEDDLNPTTLDLNDEDESKCLQLYNRVLELVRLKEGSGNDCPFELNLYVREYKVKEKYEQ